LAEDLAARLDTIGHLTSLRRLGVAPFSDAPQWTLKALESMSRDERRALLMPVDAALSDWPIVDLAAAHGAR
jgi:tRNA pseudouridine55 synthase